VSLEKPLEIYSHIPLVKGQIIAMAYKTTPDPKLLTLQQLLATSSTKDTLLEYFRGMK
jgi:hypothetical protein